MQSSSVVHAAFVDDPQNPGHASNSQLLFGFLATALPSGHIFASSVHAFASGHGLNAQLREAFLPTAVPSGQMSASFVHESC